MGAAAQFNVTVRGKGGHAAMPHTTVDPVVAGAAVVTALQVSPTQLQHCILDFSDSIVMHSCNKGAVQVATWHRCTEKATSCGFLYVICCILHVCTLHACQISQKIFVERVWCMYGACSIVWQERLL